MAKRPGKHEVVALAEFVANMEKEWHRSVDETAAKAIAEAHAAYQGAELKRALAYIEKSSALHHEAKAHPKPTSLELVTEALEVPFKPKRDHARERAAAKDKLAHAAADVRILRDRDALKSMQVSQALILCGLPYVQTEKRQIERTAKVGGRSFVTVTFTAGIAGVDMPYGSDRTLLYFLINKAIRTQSRFVQWSTALEFLKDMELSDGGDNVATLRKRFNRLRGLAIGVRRTSDTDDATVLMPVISRSVLPSSLEVKAETRGQGSLRLTSNLQYGIEFGEDFFADFQRFPAPVPLDLLRKTRLKPQLQDLCLFLHWRAFGAQKESVIPWKSLVKQIWQEDQTTRRIMGRFSEAITFLRIMWPELQAEVRPEGLWIAPPLNRSYLIPNAAENRRLSGSPQDPQERTS